MKIGLRAGHSPNCLGAMGLVNEHEQMKSYYTAIKTVLEKYGHVVVNCNSNGGSAGAELGEGAAKANANNIDLFVSLHMNASNSLGHGTEALVSSPNSGAYTYAQNLCTNFGAIGFTNRGVKFEQLYEMNNIKAANIIFEICFCDNKQDITIFNKYSWEELAYRFCNAIDKNTPLTPPVEKGYVVTNYLPQSSQDYDGVNIKSFLKYFDGIDCYMRGNNNGVWIETQYLPLSKCQELKSTLGKWFYEIKK